MRFVSATTVLLTTLITCACSAQDTLHQLSNLPSQARFADRNVVVDAPRMRIQANAQVTIVADQKTPRPWLSAANKGLQRVFTTNVDPQYKLFVDWPEPEQIADVEVHRRFKAGLFGVLDVPKVPAQQEISMKLLDAQGALIASMAMHISPRWWGETWSNPAMLENSFQQLAQVLVGR